MTSVLLVFLGGGLGSVLRFGLGRWTTGMYPGFPLGTMLANTLGAFLIGLLTLVFIDRNLLGSPYREMILVGFLGGLTTFSSLCYESFVLFQTERWAMLLVYLIGNVLIGFALFLLGRILGQL
ncbi:MAG: CrcB family protein [Leptospirales bacterium]|nr:CrcB family protein [Leptospirales bacterium]